MNDGFQALTEREKETLRLLLGGHDAKSIARELGLSVHTINERLREARRKIGVSSSREAARLLGEAEQRTPNSLGDNDFGVAGAPAVVSKKRQRGDRSLAWLAGGMLIMSLIIAAVALSFALQGGSVAGSPSSELRAAASPSAAQSAAEGEAREWVALVDEERWEESWGEAATIFKSQVTADQWATAASMVREPLGAVSSRVVSNVTRTGSLPGAPPGEYEVIQFRTSFARRSEVTETIVMILEGGNWKVSGYLIN